MRGGCTVLLLLTLLPASLEGQSPAGTMELVGTFSAFQYNEPFYDDWRPAGTLRFRLVPREYVHLEAAYTYARVQKTEGRIVFHGAGGLHPPTQEDRTNFTIGVGAHAQRGRWKPFLGFGHGRFSGDPVWSWYWGLEAVVWGPFGLLTEYRAHEVQTQEDRVHRHHELGIGVAWKLR